MAEQSKAGHVGASVGTTDKTKCKFCTRETTAEDFGYGKDKVCKSCLDKAIANEGSRNINQLNKFNMENETNSRVELPVKPEIVEDYGETFERIGEYAVKLRFCGNTDRITIEELYQRFKYRILLEEFNR